MLDQLVAVADLGEVAVELVEVGMELFVADDLGVPFEQRLVDLLVGEAALPAVQLGLGRRRCARERRGARRLGHMRRPGLRCGPEPGAIMTHDHGLRR